MALRWTSLPAMLLDLAEGFGGRPMLRHWDGQDWAVTSWTGFADSVARIAASLRDLGLAPGDRVVLASENRPEFPIAETAILSLGGVVVPTYVTNTIEDHAHILRDSGARFAVVSTGVLAGRLQAASRDVAGLERIVAMEPAEGCLDWGALLAAEPDADRLAADVARLGVDDLACLIYTSGTGGLPRGTMLAHRSMLANQSGLAEATARMNLDGKRYLSFLPLSHAYEHTIGTYLLPSLGMEVVYSRGADKLAGELRQFEPAFVTAVPRLFEVLRARITSEVAQFPAWKRRLFERAVALGLRRLDGPALSPTERVEDLVLDRLVRRTVRHRFGRRLLGLVSGGSRLDPDLSGFFLALGVPVLQGYGQTEAGPVVSVNLPWDNDRRSVGRPLPGVEARMAPDGEVLIRGGLVMMGYWNDQAATEAVLRPDADGGALWLHTGDVGRMVDGRLVVQDRKRDIIKLFGGEMISPARIEGLLMAEPEIAQAVIAGEGRAHMVALIVPAEDADVAADVSGAVSRVNARLARFEQVRRWTAIEAATIENGLLTSSMKLRRRALLSHHAEAVAALY